MKKINLYLRMLRNVRLSSLLRNFLMLTAVAIIASAAFVACSKSNGEEPDGDGGGGKGKVWVDKKGGKTETFANLDDALLHVQRAGNGDYTIRIGKNQHLTTDFNFFLQKEQKITLKAESGNVEITRKAGMLHHFEVGWESTLILDKGVTLKGIGQSATYDEDVGIFVDGKGKLIMNEGAKLTNFNSSAVFLFREGVFEMNGGTICDNFHWGVEFDDEDANGSFIMNGGSISRNGDIGDKGDGYSGVLLGSGTFTMNNGIISENKNGGVSLIGYGKQLFTMKNGKIINNTGGGVNVSGNYDTMRATFIMDGGEISGNSAIDGGGVGVSSAIFTMNGGVISNNIATGSGAASYGYGGGVNLNDDSIFKKNKNCIIYGEDGGKNANTSSSGGAHAVAISRGALFARRQFTAGENDIMSWGSGAPVGWDNYP